jgi:predicted transcriptional regulator
MSAMDDNSRQKPTNGELAILAVLWDRGPSTVREVHDAMAGDRAVGYTTVLKLMQIMADKGLLCRVERGRAHVYRPAEKESDAKRDLVGDFMDRAFGGSARELVMHALAAKQATSEELAQVRSILDKLEERNA